MKKVNNPIQLAHSQTPKSNHDETHIQHFADDAPVSPNSDLHEAISTALAGFESELQLERN